VTRQGEEPVIGRFLGGVAALIVNPADETYLLLRRAAAKDFAPGAWECVTGRVDQGEGFEEALRREVREELGVDVFVEYILGTTHFYRGTAVPENELIGVLYLCTIADFTAIRLSAEHDAYRWLTAAQTADLLSANDATSAWTRALVARAEAVRPLLSAELRQFNRRYGFQL
jgi:8-oxo-dGTP diphosphatase